MLVYGGDSPSAGGQDFQGQTPNDSFHLGEWDVNDMFWYIPKQQAERAVIWALEQVRQRYGKRRLFVAVHKQDWKEGDRLGTGGSDLFVTFSQEDLIQIARYTLNTDSYLLAKSKNMNFILKSQ